jgi:hypothetical protein
MNLGNLTVKAVECQVDVYQLSVISYQFFSGTLQIRGVIAKAHSN